MPRVVKFFSWAAIFLSFAGAWATATSILEYQGTYAWNQDHTRKLFATLVDPMRFKIGLFLMMFGFIFQYFEKVFQERGHIGIKHIIPALILIVLVIISIFPQSFLPN